MDGLEELPADLMSAGHCTLLGAHTEGEESTLPPLASRQQVPTPVAPASAPRQLSSAGARTPPAEHCASHFPVLLSLGRPERRRRTILCPGRDRRPAGEGWAHLRFSSSAELQLRTPALEGQSCYGLHASLTPFLLSTGWHMWGHKLTSPIKTLRSALGMENRIHEDSGFDAPSQKHLLDLLFQRIPIL